jgi:hypothetical protein
MYTTIIIIVVVVCVIMSISFSVGGQSQKVGQSSVDLNSTRDSSRKSVSQTTSTAKTTSNTSLGLGTDTEGITTASTNKNEGSILS